MIFQSYSKELKGHHYMLSRLYLKDFFSKTLKAVFQQSQENWPEKQEITMLTAACRGIFSCALKYSLPSLKLFLAAWKVDKLFTRMYIVVVLATASLCFSSFKS